MSSPSSFKSIAKCSGVLKVGYPLYPRDGPAKVASKFPTHTVPSKYCVTFLKNDEKS